LSTKILSGVADSLGAPLTSKKSTVMVCNWALVRFVESR